MCPSSHVQRRPLESHAATQPRSPQWASQLRLVYTSCVMPPIGGHGAGGGTDGGDAGAEARERGGAAEASSAHHVLTTAAARASAAAICASDGTSR